MEKNNKNLWKNKDNIFLPIIITIIIWITASLIIQTIDNKNNYIKSWIENKNIKNYLILIQKATNLILIWK